MSSKTTLDGLPVVDATADIVLKITGRDIDRGGRGSPSKCAAAIACRRDLGAREARVYRTRTFVRENGKWVRYLTPASIRNELIVYDRGGRMMPGEHLLKAPRGTTRLGRQKPTGPKHKPGHKRRVNHIVANVRERGPRLHEGVE